MSLKTPILNLNRIAAVLLACGMLATAPAAYSQTKGGDVTAIISNDPPGLVLAFPPDGTAQVVGAKIYEGLITYSLDLKPEPSLARSWEISPDGLTYTFKLQPNVKWSDGKDFSSADVVFSLGTMLPKTSAGARQLLDQVASIEAPDASTVVIKLKNPVPYFIMVFPTLLLPIMPKHIYEDTDFAKNPANATPIGTGPFKLGEWRRGSFIRLVRNEHYWNKDRPKVDSITFRIIPDAASRAIALETGDAQIAREVDLNSIDVRRLRNDPNFKVTARGEEYYSSIAMLELNWRRPLLDDVKVRKALYHAVDRDFVLNQIWLGVGRKATGPVNSQIPFFSKDVPQYAFDLAKAKALLDEAGLKADANGARFDAKGTRAKLALLVLPGDERYRRLAEYLRETWQSIGIEVNLETTDNVGWADRIRNWNYDVAITVLAQNADPGIGLPRYYDSSNIRKGVMFTNTSGYSNKDVDKWFADANVETDREKRADLYAKIQRKLSDDVAMIWLIEVERLTISHKSINNVITTAFGPRGPWDQMSVSK